MLLHNSYDYLLTGATGQVGRYLLKELIGKGEIVVVMRRDSLMEAYKELATLVDEPDGINVVLGDLNDCALPTVKHIVNVAAYTVLANVKFERYWRDNLLLAVRLAHHAVNIGAVLHQMSSVAVGEFRTGKLTERDEPIPDTRQLPYSISKCFTELAVRTISPNARIYRLSDVIPPVADMELAWRRNHWLSILFSCRKEGFDYVPANYGIWLAEVQELAKAVILLMDYSELRYHVLGCLYHWWEFQGWAMNGQPKVRLARWVSNIILHGPDGNDVDGTLTEQILAGKEFKWTRQNDEYWHAFARQSITNGIERRNTNYEES